MDAADQFLQHPPIPRTSSSSAISAPPSPSDSVSRRRSWGKVEAGQDPLQGFDTRSLQHGQDQPAVYTVNDDPFDLDDTDPPYNSYSSYTNMYSSAQAGPSSSSLIQQAEFGGNGGSAEDEVRLTSRQSGQWSEQDPEQATSRVRRRTVRYSAAPSPLKTTGSAIKSVSQNIRRMSLRVVNLAGSGLERLDGGDDERYEAGPDAEDELPDLSTRLPIRGRTICCLGPDSRVRLALYRALVYPCAASTFTSGLN